MDIGIEISLYPLQHDYAPLIHEFLARLSARPGLRVVTNSMSTQVFGGYEVVMQALQVELRATLDLLKSRGERGVLVMKLLGPLPEG